MFSGEFENNLTSSRANELPRITLYDFDAEVFKDISTLDLDEDIVENDILAMTRVNHDEKVTPNTTANDVKTNNANEEEINEGSFDLKLVCLVLNNVDICKLETKRRSDSMNNFDREAFRPDALKDKQASFNIDRPFLWFRALQEYTVRYNIVNRYELKRKKNEKVSIIKILLCFMESKEVKISINFVTGILNVKGKSYNDWVDNEFKKVQSLIINDIKSNEVTTEDVNERSCYIYTNDGVAGVTKGEGKDEDEGQGETRELWNSIDTLSKAIMNIETTVNDISLRVNKNREIIDDNFIQLDNRIKQLVKDYDQKLSLYQEISDKSLNQNVENLTSKLNNKISSSKQVISAFKNEIQRKLEDLTNIPAEPSGELEDKIKILES